MPLSPAARAELLDIARSALQAKLTSNTAPPSAPQNPELLQPAGCFVSLHQRSDHALRGCIGRLEATAPLWQVVRETAVDVLGDPRFTTHRVTAEDLQNVEIELTVLSPLKPAPSP